MEFHSRKPTRLNGYDYSSQGAYFVTICTHDRKCLLSNIVGAIHESPSKSNQPSKKADRQSQNILTEYGIIVQQIIEFLPVRFNISIPYYVIMPNHIHLIIEIHNTNTRHKPNCEDSIREERAIRESPLQRHHRSILDKTIGFMKMNAAKKINRTYGEKFWQRSYHDHIIRDEDDYWRIAEYIENNVSRWQKDCFYL